MNAIFGVLLGIIFLVWLLIMIGLTWFASFAGWGYGFLAWTPILFLARRPIFNFAKRLWTAILDGFREGLANAAAKKAEKASKQFHSKENSRS